MDDTLLDTSGGMDEAWDVTLAAFAPSLGFDAAAMREAIRREATEFWRDEAAMTAWRTRLADARRHVIELALGSLGHDPRGAHDVSERYGHEVFARLRLFDDAIPTLEGLRDEGFRLAILTNGPAEMQRAKVERILLQRQRHRARGRVGLTAAAQERGLQVARLVVRESPLFEVDERYGRLVAAAFSQRRKTLRNALRSLLDAAAIESCGIDPGARPETLAPAEFGALARLLPRG